jgi:hypothetical protein
MGWWVSPIIGGVELELLRPVRGFSIVAKCGEYVVRQPSVLMACYCSKLVMIRRGHVTCLVFEGRASHRQWA